MIGVLIGNYRITNKIGSGGMAEVFEARHITFKNRKAAIKILDPLLAQKEQIARRFLNEARIMAELEHNNIVSVIDFIKDDKHLAIIMELLEGISLSEYIKNKGAIPLDESLLIFRQVLNAFAYAHNHGVIHRDVKPSNIFLETKKNNNVKILDFGIAKIIESDLNLTSTGTQMGTPVYMSPEQVNDSKNISKQSDIYSLGVLLYYMLSGKPPYDTTKLSGFEIFTKIVNEPLPPLYEYANIDAAVKIATHKDPEKRFASCEDFEDALLKLAEENKVLDNENIEEKTKIFTNKENSEEKTRIYIDQEKEEKKTKIYVEKDKKYVKKKKSKFSLVLLVLLLLFITGLYFYSEDTEFIYQLKNYFLQKDNKSDFLNEDLLKDTVEKKTFSEETTKNQDKQDWDIAQKEHTLKAYKRYINKHPNGQYVEIAKQKIDILTVSTSKIHEEDIAWQKAKKKNTIKSYRNYIKNFPEGKNVKEAKAHIAVLSKIPNIKMIAIPGGTFLMGNPQGDFDEGPPHIVKIKAFEISETEITQKVWKTIMDYNPSRFKGDKLPVERVSWTEVQKFILKLNRISGKKYRLPTEAEWEYAASGGNIHQKWAGTDYENSLDDYAWYWANSDKKTHNVASKKKNKFGLYDMSGNVYEWCSDIYSSNYYKNSPMDNPVGPLKGTARVFRGGSWGDNLQKCTTTNRANFDEAHKSSNLGFRLVLDKY